MTWNVRIRIMQKVVSSIFSRSYIAEIEAVTQHTNNYCYQKIDHVFVLCAMLNLLKVNNKGTRAWPSDVFYVNFEHIPCNI